MANFDTLKTAIDANIKTNGTQDITGGKMNSILKQMVDATDEQLTELESEKKSFVYEFVGKGRTEVLKKLRLQKDRPYLISLGKTVWDVTGLEDRLIFTIGYYDGTYHDVVKVAGVKPEELQNAYWYTQTEECQYTYVQIKANEGVVVPITISELSGNISLISNTLPNIDSNAGVLDLGEDPNMFIGSAVFTRDNMKNYRSIPIQTEGGVSQNSGRRKLWYNILTGMFGTSNYTEILRPEEILIGSFAVTYSETGLYLGTLNGVNLPFDYTIDGEYKDTTEVQTLIAKSSDIPNRSFQVIGKGNTGIMTKFYPKKGVEYIIETKAWEYSEVAVSQNGFTYGYSDGTTTHDVFQLSVRNLSNLKQMYKVTFDTDFEYCYVFLRANEGEFVNFSIYEASKLTLIQGETGIGFTPTLNSLPNIDTKNKILDLGSDPVLYLGREYYAFGSLFPNNPEYYRAIPIYAEGLDTGAIKLVFNINTKRMYAKGATVAVEDNERVIGGMRLIYSTHDFISANLPFDYTVDGKTLVQREVTKEKNKYSGERPNLPRFYEVNTLLTLSQAGQYGRVVNTQGMDIYANKYLFQGNNPNASETDNYNNIFVIDLETNTLMGGFEYKKESHVNTVNCGALYDSADTYPLLYVSECYYGHGCDVIRLNNDLSSYQSIQRISYAGSQYFSGWTAYDWTIDLENSFIYAFGTNNGFTQILKFALPSPTSGDVEFSDEDILEVFEFTGAYIYQGAKVINNQMFIPFGFGSTEYPAYMKVFDMSRKAVISHIPLDGFGETEAVAFYKGNLIIVDNSGNPTYREIIL